MIADYVLIEGVPRENINKQGVILPGNVAEGNLGIGIVKSVGPGRRATATGELIPLNVKVGDKVKFKKQRCDHEDVAGVTYYYGLEECIYGITE